MNLIAWLFLIMGATIGNPWIVLGAILYLIKYHSALFIKARIKAYKRKHSPICKKPIYYHHGE